MLIVQQNKRFEEILKTTYKQLISTYIQNTFYFRKKKQKGKAFKKIWASCCYGVGCWWRLRQQPHKPGTSACTSPAEPQPTCAVPSIARSTLPGSRRSVWSSLDPPGHMISVQLLYVKGTNLYKDWQVICQKSQPALAIKVSTWFKVLGCCCTLQMSSRSKSLQVWDCLQMLYPPKKCKKMMANNLW